MRTTGNSTRPDSQCKLSISIERELRQDLKAVASLSGKNVADWVKTIVRQELKRMEPEIQALRSITSR